MKKRLTMLTTCIMSMATSYGMSADHFLKINTTKSSITLSRTQLLQMKTNHFTMRDSRAYPGIPVLYTAVKLCDLLKPYHVNPSDTIEFISADHFYSLVPASVVMRCTQHDAIGYVAIEPANQPWPPLKYNIPDAKRPKDGTAGPFAVLWNNPEKSYISNEYWAWKLSEISIHRHPPRDAIIQPPKTANTHIKNGYFAYVSRCSGCHTINDTGKGKIGPDLNHSFNKSSIFNNDVTLKKFIRDPQSVRRKTNDRMSGTNEKFLSDKDLNDLIRYLRYTAK